ncbi:MAG: PrsW family intramembrane metalloprotease [Treponema sp.]|nr:PrsW family intramembrane metalloprotease [Treponema sp.]
MILILISSLPVIAVYIWFRIAKYQFSLVRFLFALLAGTAAFFPALILQGLLAISQLSGRAVLFYHFFVRIAFTEEISRLLMLFIFFLISGLIKPAEKSGRPISYNVVKRGTAIGLVAGLGFALLESAVYGASDTGVLLIRAVTAAPLHGACGSRVGAAAVLFRTNPVQAIFRILTAVAIHGVYDLMVIQSGFPAIAAVLIAISALVNTILTIKGGWVSEENEPPPVYNWSGESAPLESQPSLKSESTPLEPQPSLKSEGSPLDKTGENQ